MFDLHKGVEAPDFAPGRLEHASQGVGGVAAVGLDGRHRLRYLGDRPGFNGLRSRQLSCR